MVNTDTGNVIMIHSPKDVEDLNNMYKAYYSNATKLMIVAHPDDELIFGGFSLIENNNYKPIKHSKIFLDISAFTFSQNKFSTLNNLNEKENQKKQ